MVLLIDDVSVNKAEFLVTYGTWGEFHQLRTLLDATDTVSRVRLYLLVSRLVFVQ